MNFLTVRLVAAGSRRELSGQGLRITIPADKAAKLERTAGDEVLLGIRPENLLLRAPAPACQPLLARVDIVEAIGSDIYLNFSHAQTQMTARVEATADIKVGQEVALYPDPTRIHLFDPQSGATLL